MNFIQFRNAYICLHTLEAYANGGFGKEKRNSNWKGGENTLKDFPSSSRVLNDFTEGIEVNTWSGKRRKIILSKGNYENVIIVYYVTDSPQSGVLI